MNSNQFTTPAPPRKTSNRNTPLRSRSLPPLTPGREAIPQSPRSGSQARLRMRQGVTDIAALNAGIVNPHEPTNLMESVEVMKDATETFANGLNAMKSFLDDTNDIMEVGLNVDQPGIELWREIDRDGGRSRFEEISRSDAFDQSSHQINAYVATSERILDTVNYFFVCFQSLQDVMATLHSHKVTEALATLSDKCNKARLVIEPNISKFHDEAKLFRSILRSVAHPNGANWEELKLTVILRRSIRDAHLFPMILNLNGKVGKANLESRDDDELQALLDALQRVNFRQHEICKENLKKAIAESRFDDTNTFMVMSHIYVDKRNNRLTKIALIRFYLGLTDHYEKSLIGFRQERRKNINCFTKVLGASEPNSQQFVGSSTAGTTFASTDTRVPYAGGAPSSFPGPGTGARAPYAGGAPAPVFNPMFGPGTGARAPYAGGAPAPAPASVPAFNPMTGRGPGAASSFPAPAPAPAPSFNPMTGPGLGARGPPPASFDDDPMTGLGVNAGASFPASASAPRFIWK